VVGPPRRTATIYRSAHDIRVLHADEAHALADVLPGCSAVVGAFFA
jgi:hypothetical protein